MKRKYFTTKGEANKSKSERTNKGELNLHVFKMPKGSKKAGRFIVCSEIEYLNTY